MVKQHTLFHSVNSVAGVALLGLALDKAACELGRVFSPIAEQALEALPSVALAALQVTQGCAFDHHWLLQCMLRGLASFWPLVSQHLAGLL